MCWIAFIFTVGMVLIQSLGSGYPSMDWFQAIGEGEGIRKLWSVLLSPTVLHMIELSIMITCFYVNRNFPAEYSITQEVGLNLLIAWLMNTGFDFLNTFKRGDQLGDAGCGVLFRVESIFDFARAYSFVLILHVISRNSFSYFPLPFTWIFNDLSKFIFEPICFDIFAKYLKEKEPSHLPHLEKIVKLYLKGFGGNKVPNRKQSFGSTSGTPVTATIANNEIDRSKGSATRDSNRDTFLECLQVLEPPFERYKKSKSFLRLYNRIKEFEEINEHLS